MSWRPDPDAFAFDAFVMKWDKGPHYAFLRFSQIPQVINKLMKDEAKVLLIIPLGPNACWFPHMLKLLVSEPLVLPKRNSILQLPHSHKIRPLHKKLQLLGVRLSAKSWRHKDFKETFVKSCAPHGKRPLTNNMRLIYKNGKGFVV